MITKPIFPCLWYDGKAREAAEFYCEIFPNSKILSDNGLVVKFELNGREFMGLNGGPNFKFDEAVSFCIECETQEEIDYYWENLLKDGGRVCDGRARARRAMGRESPKVNIVTGKQIGRASCRERV